MCANATYFNTHRSYLFQLCYKEKHCTMLRGHRRIRSQSDDHQQSEEKEDITSDTSTSTQKAKEKHRESDNDKTREIGSMSPYFITDNTLSAEAEQWKSSGFTIVSPMTQKAYNTDISIGIETDTTQKQKKAQLQMPSLESDTDKGFDNNNGTPDLSQMTMNAQPDPQNTLYSVSSIKPQVKQKKNVSAWIKDSEYVPDNSEHISMPKDVPILDDTGAVVGFRTEYANKMLRNRHRTRPNEKTPVVKHEKK